MAVRILGATLTTRAGNSGSWALGDVHASVQHARELADARKFSSTARRDLHFPFFWFNRFVIADAIGADPEDILDAVPEMRFRIAKETSPQERAQIITTAINEWGLLVDEEQLHDEFDIDTPRPGSKAAPGRPQQVTNGGALVGSVEASRDGAEAPGPEAGGEGDATDGADGAAAAPTSPTGAPATRPAPTTPSGNPTQPGGPPARTSASILRDAVAVRERPMTMAAHRAVDALRELAPSLPELVQQHLTDEPERRR